MTAHSWMIKVQFILLLTSKADKLVKIYMMANEM